MNKDKHKFFIYRILQDVFKNKELRNILAFKGGTSLMFFHGLPRFSVDLDFNILDVSKKKLVYEKVRAIAIQYGQIADEQIEAFRPDYRFGLWEGRAKLENRTIDALFRQSLRNEEPWRH